MVQTEGFQDALGAGYRLLERRGRGAAGEVWRAVDRRTDEIVAAKLLRSEHVSDRDLVGRFIRERSILTQLRHPNIVAVRDLVVEGDRLAIVMDYVDGGSLRDVLHDEGPLPPALAVGVVAAVLDGLASAHDQGVLHRDIKPDNVLLTEQWRQLRPGDLRLSDFGIARIVADGAGTTTGLLGTPEYMSPELLTTGECDLSTDVYGVGILLYELLAGRTPFAGPGTDYTVAHRHVSSEPPRLPVPEALWAVLEDLLAKDPGARPSASRAAAALRAVRDGLDRPARPRRAGAARPTSPPRGVRPPWSRAACRWSTRAALRRPHPPAARRATTPRPPRSTSARPGPRPCCDRCSGSPSRRGPRRPRSVRSPAPRPGGATRGCSAWWPVPRSWSWARSSSPPASDGGKPADRPSRAATAAAVSQQDQPLPTGLTISRKASYEPSSGTVELTVTYAAQTAPLAGRSSR